MSTASLGGIGLDEANANNNQVTRAQSLGQEEFLRILLTQLNFQDPLKPLDNQEFIAQLAQFTSLEQTRQLNTGMSDLIAVQSISQAVSLLNRTVEVTTGNTQEVGTVSTLVFRNGEPLLTVRKADNSILTDVRLPQISLVR